MGQRAHETGVRTALGAQPHDILPLVLGHGARMALVGVAIGAAAAFGLTRLMASQLFGVTVHDPLTFAFVAVLLLLRLFCPATSTILDPIVVLRSE